MAMDKEQINLQLAAHYGAFTEYIQSLPEADYSLSLHGKWSAAQQLNHIVLSVKPLAQVSAMEKDMIAATFGLTQSAGRTYDDLKAQYLQQLSDGGKAPERFVPAVAPARSREEMTAELSALVSQLSNNISTFTEQQLDTFQLPHPLLGNISFREMTYNAIYHVQHHQAQVEAHLKGA